MSRVEAQIWEWPPGGSILSLGSIQRECTSGVPRSVVRSSAGGSCTPVPLGSLLIVFLLLSCLLCGPPFSTA